MRRALKMFNRLEELTLTLTLLGLASVACVQVGTRYLLGISFDWFEEGSRYLAVFVTFLGASAAVRRGATFSMELLVDALPERFSRLLKVVVAFFSGSCFAMIAWYGFTLVIRNHKFGVTSAAIGAPMWLVYLPIPVFSILIALRFFGVGFGKILDQAKKGSGER